MLTTAGEQMIRTNGVELCLTADGDPADPTILLVHGAGHSLLSWPDELCRRLADGGRYVIRYDSRDSGRSTSYPPGKPGYALRDLVADLIGLLDAMDRERAHILGMSQGAAIAQLAALDVPRRVTALTLTCATPGGPGHAHADLPPMSGALDEFFASSVPEPDWSDRAAVVDYLVEAERPFAGSMFDEGAVRDLSARIADRATSIASQLTNPFLIDAGETWRHRLREIHVPTLVLHGTEDPLFPYPHGEALTREIPGARLLHMPRTGHEVIPPHVWNDVIPAILDLTG